MKRFAALETSLKSMTEEQILVELANLRDQGRERQLRIIYHHFCVRDCHCPVKILPCPWHAQWFVWRARGHSLRSIAYLSYRRTGKKVSVAELSKVLRKNKNDCDCPPVVEPCQHSQGDTGYVLPLSAQAWLAEMFNPKDFVEPPTVPVPSMMTLKRKYADLMSEREKLGYHLRHKGDIIGVKEAVVGHDVSRTREGYTKPGGVKREQSHDARPDRSDEPPGAQKGLRGVRPGDKKGN